ncbi:glutathione S-transferase family protein, partial [Pseudomonas aeruginosa]|uniref:glutathione S-transferase family protein n=3 Tax=Pseudomonas TaxID=286 RepID=UPI00396A4773
MSLTLYGAPLSPFVRKVRLLLAEKGLDYQLEAIAPFGQPAWYREISPLGRIPALRDGDLALADLAIASQLVNLRHAGENLDEQRWPALAAHFARMLERPAMQALLPGERRTLD